MKALLLAFLLAQGTDLATTAVGIHRGCMEVNPLYGRNVSITDVVIRKGAATVVIGTVAWGVHKKGQTKAAKIILWTGLATASMATAWNIHTLPHC